MNDSQKISDIKQVLEHLWTDDDGNPLLGDKLVEAAIDDPPEYKDLRSRLIQIQNIVFTN